MNTIAIIGLEYACLPLAQQLAGRCARVLGLGIDPKKAEELHSKDKAIKGALILISGIAYNAMPAAKHPTNYFKA